MSDETKPVITTYIEMPTYAHFKPTYIEDPNLTIMQMGEPLNEFYRFLYSTVGRDYQWIDRLSWSDAHLHTYLSLPSVAVWVAYYKGTPAGYIELGGEADEPGTEISCFGLIKQFHGRGIGKHLLSFGVQKAWATQPQRVWLHTCTLDGPYALENYNKRGFSIYKQTTKEA